MCNLLTMHEIMKSYDRIILNELDLTVKLEEIVAIYGDSGSGKSTLLNILGCIEEKDSGFYEFDHTIIKDKIDYSDIRLNKIGFIYQNYNLISKITCYENIFIPSYYATKKVDYEWFNELVNWLNIEELLLKDVNLISGGEKQRIAIARALLLKPICIIADEPTGNLDVENKKMVLNILKKYKQKMKASVIIVTHDKFVAEHADTVYVLKDGKLYEQN